jgi:hypothetical protein
MLDVRPASACCSGDGQSRGGAGLLGLARCESLGVEFEPVPAMTGTGPRRS